MAYLYLRWILLLGAFNYLFGIGSVSAQQFTDPREKEEKLEDQWFNFITRPDIQAPKFDVRVYDEEAISPGYWFVAPYEDHERFQRGKPWVGPYIYDFNGSLVWSGTPFVDRFKLWDFRKAEFGGEDVLTGVSHRENAGFIINSNYEFVKGVTWKPNFDNVNPHEFNLVENGTRALVLTQYPHDKASWDKSAALGFYGQCEIEHQGIMELDITVDPPRTVFEWSGLEHIGMEETTQRPKAIEELCTGNWDLHHFNALDKFPDGDYLLSSRHTSTIFKISHVDGSIVWRLGGTMSDWDIPSNLIFSRQHHARVHAQNETHIILSFFDNAEGWDHEPTNDYSRGVLVALHTQEMRAELLVEAIHPLRERSDARGNNQLLPNGNFFVGWSKGIRISEHSPDGTLLLHAVPRAFLGTYRSYKFPWVGRPKYPPNVHSAAFVGGTPGLRTRLVTRIAVSWNGATEVKSWKLFKSNAEGKHLQFIEEKEKLGFETHFDYGYFAECVVVEAYDIRGQPIGRSDVAHTLPPVEEGGTEMNETTIASYVADDWNRYWMSLLTNPTSTFIAGFVACAVIWAVFRHVRKPRSKAWWWPQGAKYATLSNWKQNVFFGQELDRDSDEYEDAVELRDKNYT